MDAKITKTRLAHYLSYDLGKMVAVMVAIIVLWLLIFQTTATRITAAQEYGVYNYAGAYVGEKFRNYATYADKDVFSYEVMKTGSYDISVNGDEIDTVMQARVSTSEIDAMFITDNPANKEAWKYKDDKGVEHDATYLEGILHSCYSSILPFDGDNGLLALVEGYLNEYFTNGYEDVSSLDEQKLEQDFRARIKKDKRFKKEEQKAEAVLKEIERLKRYAEALTQFNDYLADGVVALQEKTVYFAGDDGVTIEHVLTRKYSLNLCPDETKTNFKDSVYYFEELEEGDEGEVGDKTSKNLNLILFRMPTEYNLFLGEHLLYINQIIAECVL